MSDPAMKTCTFLVGDSPWIKAQVLVASGKMSTLRLTESDRDPHLRIDVGTLIETLRGNRIQGPSFLYNSQPLSCDSVWKKLDDLDLQTNICDHEKSWGTPMATDLSYIATELEIKARYDPAAKQQKANTVFVVITGKGDMLPPIKRVLDLGIRIELRSWKSMIFKEYLELAHNHDLLEVHFLDRVLHEKSFTHFRSTRKNRRFDPCHTIVLCNFVDLLEKNLESSLEEMLLQFGQLFFITRQGSGTHVLLVEFPLFNDIEGMLSDARKLFQDSLTVLSWHENTSQLQKESSSLVADTSYLYVPLKKSEDLGPRSTT